MLLEQLCRSEDANRRLDAEAAIDMLDYIINGCNRVYFCITQLTLLHSCFSSLYQQLIIQVEQHLYGSTLAIGVASPFIPSQYSVDHPGRPKISINLKLVELLHSAGYKLKEIANSFLISRVTLWRSLKEEKNISLPKFCGISDSELDNIVRDIKSRHPFIVALH